MTLPVAIRKGPMHRRGNPARALTSDASAAMSDKPVIDTKTANHRDQALSAIGQALDGLRYGTIILTVHDAKVVQLEVTEKKRFDKA
jgi:hypothetical protein